MAGSISWPSAGSRTTCAFTGTRAPSSRLRFRGGRHPHYNNPAPRSPQRMARMLKKRLLTPGPTPVPEETLLELAKPVFYHRTGEFREILAEVLADLQYVFQTRNPVIPLTSS